MKTTTYSSNSSEIISDTSCISTRVLTYNNTKPTNLHRIYITVFGLFILMFLLSFKSFSQGNGGKICLIDGASSACGAQNLTYTMTSTGGVNNASSYTWSLTAGSTASFCSVTSGTTVCVSVTVGTFTLNLTVQGNGNGNKATCSKVVTINPLPSCAIFGSDPTCTTLTNVYNGPNAPAGKTYGYSWSISGAVNASISGVTNEQSVSVVSGSCNSSYILDLIVTDIATGCVSQCTRAFGFIDDTAPSISAAGDNLILNCPANPIFTPPTATDACSSATVVEVSDNTVGDACNYTRVKTWKAIDACGNESEIVTQAITVRDVTAPSVSAAGPNMTLDCPMEPVFIAPRGTDECSSVQIVEVSDNTIGDACNYTRVKTWKAVDACGNESELVSQAITVHDVTAPSISDAGSNMTIDCPAEPIFTPPTGSDECSLIQIIEVSDNTVGDACNYTRTKTWKAVDACGNESGLVSQAITVRDITPPAISSAGPDKTINCPDQPIFTAPKGSDECGAFQVVEVSDITLGGICCYTRTKTWKVVDACGNESDLVSQSITVHDTTAPSISSAGSDVTIDCPAEPVFTPPTGTDECGSVQVFEVSDNTTGDGCNYTRTKTWRAVDVCGNISDLVSQSITVHDITEPSISGEGDDLYLAGCNSNIVFTAPVASDLCDFNPAINVVNTFTVQNPDGSVTYTRIWNAVDQCNNTSASVDQSITVGLCETFCTASQGFYGNSNGMSLLPSLLSQGDLIIGKPGKSFTIKLADALCLNSNLPSGGPAKMLPSGDALYTGSCATTTSITLNSNGRFDNILLGQTITLGLNLRKDPNLGGLILNGTVMTTSNGTKTIPQPVLNALTSIYGIRSVANLFDLANRALAGLSTDAANLATINHAVSAINEGFDGCGSLTGFNGNANRNNGPHAKTESAAITVNAVPNPFDNNTSLEFSSPVDAKVTVEIYNVAGAKIATLFNDHVRAHDKKSVMFEAQHLPNGMYIYVLTANDKSYYHKLLLVR